MIMSFLIESQEFSLINSINAILHYLSDFLTMVALKQCKAAYVQWLEQMR